MRLHLSQKVLLLAPVLLGPLAAPSFAQWAPGGALVSGLCENINFTPIGSDQAGGAFISWRGYLSSIDVEGNVFCQRITAAGLVAPGFPSSGLRLCETIGRQGPYQVVPDGAGGAVVLWSDLGTNGQALYDIYAQHLLPNGAIDPTWPINGAPVAVGPGQAFLVAAFSDAVGGLVVFWDSSFGVSSDIYMLHLGPDGLPAPGWPQSGRKLMPDDPDRHPGGLAIQDGAGGYFVAWHRQSPVQNPHIYCQRITAEGEPAPGWPAFGKLVVTGRGCSGLAADGQGGVYLATIVASSDGFSGKDLYLHHLTGAGDLASGWLAGGNAICTAPLYRQNLQVIPDGSGGAIMQWMDSRMSGYYELLYASRMSPDGTRPPGWPADGLRVSTQESFQGVSSMLADGAGGAYFAFNSTYPNSTGYIQHLRANGTVAPGWPGEGYLLGSYAQDPQLATDGSAGAIVAWHTPVDYKVYAQRYVFDGIVATQLSLASSDIRSDRVTLVWQGPGAAALNAIVYRREAGGAWQSLGPVGREADDRVRYEDRSVSSGTRYGYRLGYDEGGIESFTQETWVDVPLAATLSLEGLRPNPAIGDLRVAFSLPRAGGATVEVIDLTGRVVRRRDLASAGAGQHVVPLNEGERLQPGAYWLRLTHSGQTLTTKGVVLR